MGGPNSYVESMRPENNQPLYSATRRRFLELAAGTVLLPYGLSAAQRWIGQPSQPSSPDDGGPRPEAWKPNTLTACWIGHSTVLMNFFGTTIITDPVFSNEVGIDMGFLVYGPRRITQPALRFDQLPPIAIMLISHAHMDHLDLRTVRRFDRSMPVVVPAHTADLLLDQGFTNVRELDWGHSLEINGVQIEAIQVKHNGARFLWEPDRADGSENGRSFNGYLLSRNNIHVVFGGDTGLCDFFKPLRQRFNGIDLAIMPIGGYEPKQRYHATPEQTVAMCKDMGARALLPIHWETFVSTSEHVDEPMDRLKKAMEHETFLLAADDIGCVWTLEAGRSSDSPRGE